MDNIIFLKAIVAIILVLWAVDALRTKKAKPNSDPAIAEANARERYEWRYFRWGFNIIRVVCVLYVILPTIKFLLT